MPIAEVRAASRGGCRRREDHPRRRSRHACLRRLTEWLAVRVLAAAETRRAESRLEFHDLLVLARDLLRSSPAARRGLHQRYQRLLLDEFQDTDPIQIELAVRIAAGETADAEDWHDIRGAARSPVRGRRPQAVDLPLPAGLHRHLPRRRAAPGRRGQPDHELPQRRAGARLGERGVRAT